MTDADVAVLFVHGVEVASPDYAQTAIELLHDELARAGGEVPRVAVRAALYADVFEKRERALLGRVGGDTGDGAGQARWHELARLATAASRGDVPALLRLVVSGLRRGDVFRWPTLRWMLVNYLGDAVAYQLSPGDRRVYDAVQERIAAAVVELARETGGEAPLMIVAHSMGSVVASDFLWDLQVGQGMHGRRRSRLAASARRLLAAHDTPMTRGETLAALCTLGSPLAIWTLRAPDEAVPATVPHPDWRARAARVPGDGWVNVHDRDDVATYPLAGLGPAYAATVTDREVSLAPRWLAWTPLAHPFYWNDRSVVRELARVAAGLARAAKDASTTKKVGAHD